MGNLGKSNYAKTEGLMKVIFRRYTAVVITNIVLQFGDNRLKGREVTRGSIWGDFRKCNYVKTRGSIDMISRGFAANDIANFVLKFGDNRTKRKGFTEGG